MLMDAIVQYCIQPRCLLSPMDADFCAQFIKTLHLLGTPGFHTLGCYNRVCTSYEYSAFLATLNPFRSWINTSRLFFSLAADTKRVTTVRFLLRLCLSPFVLIDGHRALSLQHLERPCQVVPR